MLLDDLVLVVGQGARLAEQVIRHPDLADVVQEAGQPHRADRRLVEAVLAGHEDGVPGDVLGVPLGVAVLRVHREDQPLQDVEGRGPAVVDALGAGHA